MKKFMNPEIEVQVFAVEDVVTTSVPSCDEDNSAICPDELELM